ncbi:MAG: sugar-binding protein [Kiritimatiellae bacterium]|nr:sugar-binding protein [Kiritimatiellia bacterium]
MKKTSRSVWIACACSALLTAVAGAADRPQVTLYLPFDGNVVPQVAAEKTGIAPVKPGNPARYADGVKGQAVLLGDNSLACPTAGNLTASQGAICFWAKPVDWDPQQPETVWRAFWTVSSRLSGEGRNDWISFWRYPESMSKAFDSAGAYNFAAQAESLDNMILDIKDWRRDVWRFFAMTWNRDGDVRLYQDGRCTGRRKRAPTAMSANLNHLLINGGGCALDDFKVYDGPLSDDEVTQAYLALADAARDRSAPGAAPTDATVIPSGPPRLTASPLPEAPKADGSDMDPAWSGCIEAGEVPTHGDRAWPANETAFRVAYTPQTLYVRVQCASRGAKPRVAVRDHDGPVFTDDAIELFIEPVAGTGRFYQFVANAIGARFEAFGADASWNGAWEAIPSVQEGSWTLTFAIPFATLGIEPATGMTVGFNLARDDRLGNQLQSWADLGGGAFANPGQFGRLVLGANAIGASGLGRVCRDRSGVVVQGQATNATGRPQSLRWLMTGTAGAEPFRFERTRELPPGAALDVVQTAAVTAPGAWVAWRSLLATGDTILYASPALRCPLLRLPVLGRAQEPLVLSNPFVRLVFDANTGQLLSLRHLATGHELLAGPPGPLFRLDTVNFQRHPLHFREDDVVALTPDLTTFRSAGVEPEFGAHGDADAGKQKSKIKNQESADAQVLTVVHQFEQGVTVTATVRLDADDPIAKWDIAVTNALPRRPRDGVIVHRVSYPMLAGLKAADADADQAAVLPLSAGRLVREPARNLVEAQDMGVPGWTSMSWMDLSGPQAGLYLASHDVRPVVQTILKAKGETGGRVSFSVTRWSVLWPGHAWTPRACSVGLHEGDWHWSADRYREWYYATVKPRPTPAWILAEDGWMFEGMNDRNTCQDLARTLTTARNKGINYIQSWQAPGHFNIPDIYGWYLANVYGGGERDFMAAIRDVHRRGGRVGFYLNIGDMEARMGTIMHQPQYRQKLSADTIERMPASDPISDGWLESAVMQPDGSYRMGWPSGYDTWSGCLGSAKGWGPWYYYNVVTKHAQQYKADTWYADCHPGLSDGMCFSPHHAHPFPAALGQITLDFGERVARNVSKDFGMLGEGFCDRFFTFNTHALWCIYVQAEDSEPAIFRYTHPQFPLFSGTCSYTWGGACARYTKLLGLDRVSFADHMRYMLLYGMRFDTFAAPLYGDPASWGPGEREERDIIALRRCVHQDLEDADFRDQIGLGTPPAKTQARIFVRRDRTGGLITIFDARPEAEKTAFPLSLRLVPHGLAGISRAELCLPGGTTQALPSPAVTGCEAVFQIPKTDARMMIVRFCGAARSREDALTRALKPAQEGAAP